MVHIACENDIFQERLGINLYYESTLVFTSFVVLGVLSCHFLWNGNVSNQAVSIIPKQ